ncbi:hypothetical protein VCHA53O466_50086 [Vibrio chagasii]|nr:hypothetical protein VCHA53O466_50086 [Vibrio chagasii]
MNTISLADKDKLNELASASNEYVLKGLPKKSWAMILGEQDLGKSKMMFSLAYSLATNIDIIGLLPSSTEDRKPRKVAIWASEEDLGWASRKVLAHMSKFSPDVLDAVQANVTLIDDSNEDGDKEYLFTDELKVNTRFVDALTEQLEGVDVLIIDTLRDAMGIGDEVNEDNKVKVLLSKLVRDADCSVVYLHHPRKSDVGASISQLSTASGSGFSRTNAKARVHYTLTRDRKSDELEVSFAVKANNIPRDERVPIKLAWLEMGEHSIQVDASNKDAIISKLTSGQLTESNELPPKVSETETPKPKVQRRPAKKRALAVTEQVVHKIEASSKTPSNLSSSVRSLRSQAVKLKSGSNEDQV